MHCRTHRVRRASPVLCGEIPGLDDRTTRPPSVSAQCFSDSSAGGRPYPQNLDVQDQPVVTASLWACQVPPAPHGAGATAVRGGSRAGAAGVARLEAAGDDADHAGLARGRRRVVSSKRGVAGFPPTFRFRVGVGDGNETWDAGVLAILACAAAAALLPRYPTTPLRKPARKKKIS